MTLRCLIVDDSARFLEAARRLLERHGIEVAGVATTVTEALDLIDRIHPDVTLVDIDLGGESGFELVRRLQGNDPPPSNVILISTHAEDDFAELVAASAAIGFLSKADLSADAIRDLLDRKGVSGAAG
jgi:two-component system, NarL family, nitrate/nitrite response regulator NarL